MLYIYFIEVSFLLKMIERQGSTLQLTLTTNNVFIVMNFVNSALGGCLSMMGNAYGQSILGIFWYSIISILSLLLTHFSILFICRSAQMVKSESTYALAKYYFGSKSSIITKLFVCFGNASFIINDIQVFADVSNSILKNWAPNAPSWLVSREFAVSIALLIMFYFMLVRNIKKLENLSSVCIVFVLFVLTMLIINGAKCISNNDPNCAINTKPLPNDNFKYFVSWKSIFQGLPIICWCWCLQFNVLPIYLSIHPHSRPNKINSISIYTCIILFIIYSVQGFFVYCVYGSNVDEDFTDNIGDYFFNSNLGNITQFIIALSCFMSIPLVAFECRTNFHAILLSIYKYCCKLRNGDQIITDDYQATIQTQDVDNSESNNIRSNSTGQFSNEDSIPFIYIFIEGLFISILTSFIALKVTDLNLVLSIVGATYACYISYFLPSGLYIKHYYKCNDITLYDKILYYIAIFSCIFGIIVCVAGLSTL